MDENNLMEIILAYDYYIQNNVNEESIAAGWRPLDISAFYDSLYDFYNFSKLSSQLN